jgi:hypothetical protein
MIRIRGSAAHIAIKSLPKPGIQARILRTEDQNMADNTIDVKTPRNFTDENNQTIQQAIEKAIESMVKAQSLKDAGGKAIAVADVKAQTTNKV